MKKNKVLKDFGWNLAASIVYTGIMQLLLFPLYAKILTPNEYGVLLTCIGVGNTIGVTFGSSLNNTRLLQSNKYLDNKLEGDFSLLVIIIAIISVSILSIYTFFVDIILINRVFIILYTVFLALREYGSVCFRLAINFKRNFVLYAIISITNLISFAILFVLKITNIWGCSFLLGEIAGLVYICVKERIFFERICKTILFNDTFHKFGTLIITTFLANVILYLDRILLLPILGGEAVSVYSVASFFGKSLGVLMTPLSSVLLSYYVQKDFQMTTKKYWKIATTFFALAFVFFIMCIIFSKWGTGLFYPTLIDAASPYLLIANAAAIINVTGNIIQPAVLRYANIRWQVIIQIIYGSIYLIIGIFAASKYQLLGFCLAAIVASAIRLLVLLVVGNNAISNNKLESFHE